ncbi:MAG TPA: dihydrolipoamide acetyltransferase family protein, partial [Thermoleophilaceae bacterium]|nr:dihydrolipoamide acetyltransferase family protein [Thermoleophilaceae bacterium]
VAEGTIADWKKKPGDWIERDETIVEISTDKIETEIPSPAAGRVTEILVEVGVTVPVGELLARIDTGSKPGQAHASEDGPDASDDGAGMGGGGEPDAPARADAVAPKGSDPSGTTPVQAGSGHPPPVSPVVRRIAAEHHVDLEEVPGTGMRGRITKKDVLAFIKDWEAKERPEPLLHMESPYVEDAPAPKAKPEPAAQPVASGQGEPLSLMRKKIGEHMRHSLDTAAHCTTIVEADMSGIEAKRGKLSYLPFVARSVIEALREYPLMNATLEGDRITIHDEVNLGIAVSLGEKGLIVPVVHDAHLLSHEGLAAKVKDLAARARSGELQPDEVRGGTFTITNPGRYGALLATPIINQPQVAILDLEAVVRRPVVVGGDSIAIRPMTYLCMSWDHRALDGAYAAQFLSEVRSRIEAWT